MELETKPRTTLLESVLILVFLIGCLGSCIIIGHMPPHVPILMVFVFLCFWGKWKGYSWDEIHKGISEGIAPGIVPLIIFMLIGVLVSSLIAAGTIPTIVVYGCEILSANHFLVMSFLICLVVGITVGSSFTTISTMGIVLMTIGTLMGIRPEYVAGAVISGAFCANNLSPLADTANLCAAIGDIELVTHLKSVFKTALPTAIICMVAYTFLDGGAANMDAGLIDGMVEALKGAFLISPIALLPIVVILVCSWRRLPAIPTLLLGAITAFAIYGIYHPSPDQLMLIPQYVMTGYVSNVGIETVDTLLSRGGIMSMMGAASMIILALAMGGLLVKLEVVNTLVTHLSHLVTSGTKLVISTALGSLLINFSVGEQYLSIILPGSTFKSLYKKLNVDMPVLTRTLADSGSAFNAVVPWGVSGTFIVGTLGLSSTAYVLYSFYPLLTPIVTIVVSALKMGKKKAA